MGDDDVVVGTARMDVEGEGVGGAGDGVEQGGERTGGGGEVVVAVGVEAAEGVDDVEAEVVAGAGVAAGQLLAGLGGVLVVQGHRAVVVDDVRDGGVGGQRGGVGGLFPLALVGGAVAGGDRSWAGGEGGGGEVGGAGRGAGHADGAQEGRDVFGGQVSGVEVGQERRRRGQGEQAERVGAHPPGQVLLEGWCEDAPAGKAAQPSGHGVRYQLP